MLIIKVEIWPHGNARQAESLGVIAIGNQGPIEAEDPDRCLYLVELQRNDGKKKSGQVTHRRKRGWVRLVRFAMEAIDA